MEKRKLGKSGIEFAPIAFGGNVFGWSADEETSFAVLDAYLGAGGNLAVTFASLTQNGGATLNLTGTFGTTNNKVLFTAAPTLTGGAVAATNGLLARITTNGNEFATYNTTGLATNAFGLQPFAGYSVAANILSAPANATYKAQYNTANSLTGNQTINALALTSSASGPVNVGGLSDLNPTTLTVTSGGILANGTGTSTPSRSASVLCFDLAKSAPKKACTMRTMSLQK